MQYSIPFFGLLFGSTGDLGPSVRPVYGMPMARQLVEAVAAYCAIKSVIYPSKSFPISQVSVALNLT